MMMRVLLVLMALARTAVAEPTRVLVFPVEHGDVGDVEEIQLFDARLLVALADTGQLSPVTLAEGEPCTTPACLKDLAARSGATQVLSLLLLTERGRPVLFATLFDAAGGTPLRRRDFAALSPVAVARWLLQGSGKGKPLLRVDVPASRSGKIATRFLASRLSAAKAPLVLVADPVRGDRPSFTHEVDVSIGSLVVEKRLHHINTYFDGALTATLTVRDLVDGRVVFSRTVETTASRRSNKSSREEVTAILLQDAVDEWMAEFSFPRRGP